MIPLAKVPPDLAIQYFFQDQKDICHEHYTHIVSVSLISIAFPYPLSSSAHRTAQTILNWHFMIPKLSS